MHMLVLKKLAEFLRLKEPSWQAIGAIIAVIALVISTFAAYDIFGWAFPIAHMTIREEC